MIHTSNYLIITLLVGSILGCTAKKQPINQSQAQTKSINQPLKVTIAKAELSPVEGNLSYSGTIEPAHSTPLSFLMPGLVKEVYVKEGHSVVKGQLLARLSQETQQSGYELALAKQKQAEDAYKRLQPVYKNGSLPEIKWVEIKTGMAQAKAATQMAKTNLNNGNLYAPTNGVIGRKMLETGMTVLPGSPVMQLVKLNKLLVKIPVPENEIGQIKKGQSAVIKIPALQNQQFTGMVTEIGVMANTISRTYDVKIAINNSQNKIKPGMMCNASLLQQRGARLLVPYQAVSNDMEGRTYVYIVNREKMEAQKQAIKTGLFRQNKIEVLSGLQTGQQIIVKGKHKLSNHSKISIQ